MKKLFLISALLIAAITNGFAQNTDGIAKKSSTVKIKGLKKPIYAIDGIKQEHPEFDVNSLDTDSIAEIKILKNKNAIKLFGAEAADGVILITTKSGKSNAANLDLEQKLKQISKENELTNLKVYGTPPSKDNTVISFNNKSKVIIRNPGQQSSTNDVIYILDGQKIEKVAMNSINPETIQSINIVKNESAITQYGPEASNGVVIITTKPVKNSKDPGKIVDKN